MGQDRYLIFLINRIIRITATASETVMATPMHMGSLGNSKGIIFAVVNGQDMLYTVDMVQLCLPLSVYSVSKIVSKERVIDSFLQSFSRCYHESIDIIPGPVID